MPASSVTNTADHHLSKRLLKTTTSRSGGAAPFGGRAHQADEEALVAYYGARRKQPGCCRPKERAMPRPAKRRHLFEQRHHLSSLNAGGNHVSFKRRLYIYSRGDRKVFAHPLDHPTRYARGGTRGEARGLRGAWAAWKQQRATRYRPSVAFFGKKTTVRKYQRAYL